MQRILTGILLSMFVLGAFVIAQPPSGIVQAQGGGVLEYGEEVVGEITESEPEAQYTFVGSGGDVIVVYAEPEDFNSELEPRITVTAPNGDIVVMAESFYTVETATQLPEDGKYTLSVTHYDGDEGDTYGPYRLRLLLPQVLGIGDSASDTISSEDTHYYVVVGIDSFRLFYTRHSGTFGPSVDVNLLDTGEDDLFSFSLSGFDSVGSIGGESTVEAMLRIEGDAEGYVITLGQALLDFSFGATPAQYTIEIAE